MSARVTLSEAAVMLLIYDQESERNGIKIWRLARDLDVLQKRQTALRQMITKLKESLAPACPAEIPAKAAPVPFMIGQRVLLGSGAEIGTVVASETGNTTGVWVHSPSNGYASDYALTSVKPPPNGQV